MIFTWLFGNGLDIGLGLNTSYSSFYPYMVQNTNKDNVIVQEYIKDMYTGKVYLWSDYEKRLGEITNLFNENDIRKFVYDKLDIDDCLNKYLLEQNKKLNLDYNKIVEYFKSGLIDTIHNKRNIDNEKVIKLLNKYQNDSITICPISFNYTETVKKLFAINDDVLETFRINGVPKRQYRMYIENPLYIHGTISDNEMIIGVNDKTQILNEIFAKNIDVQKSLIKNNTLEIAGQNKYNEFQKYINSSNIICLYGVSLGETDRNYWEIIKQALLKPDSLLLIYNYEDDYIENQVFIEDQKRNAVKKRFYKVSGATEDEIKIIDSKIIIYMNHCVFSK